MSYPTTSVEVLAVHVRPTVCDDSWTPVPDKAIAGEFVALLTTLTLPLTAPATVGANVTLKVAVWLGVNVVPATPVALNPAPDTVTEDIVTFEFPVFVSVTFSVLLLASFTLLKLRLVGFALSRFVTATPVPLRAIMRGEFGALLKSDTDPVTPPLVVGAKTVLNVVL
jgi:hypothetical protein